MAKRFSALDRVYREGSFGKAGPPGPGVALAERRPLAMVQIAAMGGEAEAARLVIANAIGITPDPKPNRAVISGPTTILWLGPGRWLVVEPELPGRDLANSLRAPLPGMLAAVTDLSHGRTALRISGPSARDLLAKGCSLDLHPRAFSAGACAQSLLGRVGVLLHAVDDQPSFDVYFSRSYAVTVWEWLTLSAAEYGYRVDASAI